MEQNDSSTSAESQDVILAFGRAPRHVILWSGLAAFGAVCLILGGLIWWTLSARFSLPEKTTLLIAIKNKTQNPLALLTPETPLPAPWTEALNNKSWLPIFLGAWKNETGWHSFSLMPRTRAKISLLDPRVHILQTSGPWTLIGDTDLPQTTSSFTSRELLADLLTHPFSPWSAQLDLHPFVNTNSIHLWLNGRRIQTSLTSEASSLSPLKDMGADLGLSTLPVDGFLNSLLTLIPLGTASLHELPLTPSQIHLNFDEKNTPVPTLAAFNAPLSENQLKQVLGLFGLTNKQVIQLPDGTLSTKLTLPSIEPTGTITTPDGRQIAISSSHKEIRFIQPINQTEEAVCGKNAKLLAYFSPKAINLAAHALNFKLTTNTRWYFALEQNYLILCFK